MANTPWYIKIDVVSDKERWALDVLHTGGQEAIDILDERIRRVTKAIQMTWTCKEAEKRFVGRARPPVYVPVVEYLGSEVDTINFMEEYL
jgi:hypothetical protein